MLKVDQAKNIVIRPSSAAFEPDADGLSVYLDSGLKVLGLSPAATRIHSSQFVAGIPQTILSELGLRLTADPETEDPQPAGKAHALVQGWVGNWRKVALKLAQASVCTWPGGEWSALPPPPIGD